MILSILSFNTYVDELKLQVPGRNFKAGMCLCYFSLSSHFHDVVNFLHPQELSYYSALKCEKRKKSYLIGRYSAKQAISAFIGEKNLQTILIQQGIFDHPIATYKYKQNVQVSITHCDDFGAAIAFPEAHPMGIDIEKVNIEQRHVLENHITKKERDMIRTISYSYEELLTILWSVKEALSKILKTGLTTPLHIFEINKMEVNSHHITSQFENFGQYKAISVNLGHYICTMAYPKQTEININVTAIKKWVFSLSSG